MNANKLLRHYERVADAPAAGARLRDFVVRLAVTGRLIRPETEWIETTLDDLGQWGSGGTPLKSHPEYYGGDIPWLVIGDLNDSLVTAAETHITRVGLENSSAKLIRAGTVLIAMYGSIGKLGIAGMTCATNQAIAHCAPDIEKVKGAYLFWLLRSLRSDLLSRGQGVAQQNISQRILRARPVRIPTVAEQHRIVAKIDELMALCSCLEAARAERDAARDRLAAASLARLNTPDAATFHKDVRFVLDSFHALMARPGQLSQLRQTILSLAVKGRLVQQDASAQPASVLLARIEEARSSLVAAGCLRRAKPLAAPTPEQFAFSIPPGWIVTRLGTAFDVRDGTHDTPKYVDVGFPLVTSKNLSSGRLTFDDVKFISESNHRQISERSKVEQNDVLLAMIGSIGNPVIVDTDRAFSIKNVALFKYFDRHLCSPRFLCVFLAHAAAEMKALAAGGLQPFVSLGFLRNFPMALPPLEEQLLIVARVDELMALCNRLEASVMSSKEHRDLLLESLLNEALDTSEPLNQAA